MTIWLHSAVIGTIFAAMAVTASFAMVGSGSASKSDRLVLACKGQGAVEPIQGCVSTATRYATVASNQNGMSVLTRVPIAQ